MLQIFLKPSHINKKKWKAVYNEIRSIIEAFPTKLLRLESFKGYSKHLNKKHFDLVVGKGTPKEHISIWGDWLSYTGGTIVVFYKKWKKQLKHGSSGLEMNENKPITWYPYYPYRNDGTPPDANGVAVPYQYISDRGAHYKYALIAIGTMLENRLPGLAFLTAPDEKLEEVEEVRNWLVHHFNEDFELPIYFDKPRLLDSFIHHYEDKSQAAWRIAHLFRERHWQNIAFSLQHLGYAATLKCYTQILSATSFATFGFVNILDS